MKKQKRIVPNVVRGGVAIPLGANYFLMKGKTHEQGGIDIGKDLEVENGELIKLDKNNMTIVSNAPIINGISPAEYALGGLKDGTFVDRFKQGFKYQEKYKDVNGLKDDGTKAQMGKEKTIDEMNSKMLFNIIDDKNTLVNKTYPKNYVERPRVVDVKYDIVAGLYNITERLKEGWYNYYQNDETNNSKNRFLKDKDTGIIYEDIFNNYDAINLEHFDVIPYSEIKKMLPKRDYIGGDSTNVRIKAFNKIPGIKEKIKELSDVYGIDANLLTHRFLREGFIDNAITEYNGMPAIYQKDYWKNISNKKVNGFSSLGLDDAGTHLLENRYNLRRDIDWWHIDAENEKNRQVKSIAVNNLWDGLEIKAADMEYRKNELLKRGYPEENINTYINAAYNLGLYHKDLDDAEWINKTYAVPNYYELGGKTNMKKNDRNVPPTGKKIKASLGIELNKVKNRIDTPENNRVIKITPELKLLSPEPLKPTSEQKRNLTIAKTKDFIKNNIDSIGDFTNTLVGVGSSIASNRINNKMLNNFEELPEITPFVPLGNAKLKTSYNIHPQLAKARKIANRLNRYVDRNTSSSQTAINRRRQNELDYLENVNTLYGQKENVETQLINQDRMLQHQIDQYNNQLANQDIARQDARKTENIQLRNTIAEKKAENSVALADNISSIINNMIMNRKQGRANDKTLRVMAAGFPSITKEYLKELGLI